MPLPSSLLLIDAYPQIFRAFYAIRTPMKSPTTGEPTHAVYGFVSMLLKLMNDAPEASVVIAFDAPGRTFRDDLYASYKGTRTAIPEELLSQVPRIREILDALGIPRYEIPGMEADDVIASLTHHVLTDPRPEAAGITIRILTNDKDLEQLIEDRVHVLDARGGGVIDAAALLEKKGIRPDQVVDYLTLIGDTVDNVPGFNGIGPKTATRLLQQHDTLDAIYERLETLSPAQRSTFEAARDRIPLSRSLLTLHRGALSAFRAEEALRRPIDRERCLALFEELGFHRFQEAVHRMPA